MWRWTNPEKFGTYQADPVKDLFGDWTLIMCWGGLGSRRGQACSTASRESRQIKGRRSEGPPGLGP